MIYRVRWSGTYMSAILQACPELLQGTTAEYMYLYLPPRQEEVTLCQPLRNISLNVRNTRNTIFHHKNVDL